MADTPLLVESTEKRHRKALAGDQVKWTGPSGNDLRPGHVLLGRLLGANFNITTDQAIALGSASYIITDIVVTNASTSLTTAAGGFYTGAGKTGTTLVAAAQVYSALTAAAKWIRATLAAVVGTDRFTGGSIFLSLTTAQGGAATADVYVFGYPVDA